MARTPIHPGEILADELHEIGVSAAALARTLGVPANRISQIIAGKRAISADTALRLARYFGTSPDLWMNLQKTYRARPCPSADREGPQQYSTKASGARSAGGVRNALPLTRYSRERSPGHRRFPSFAPN